MIEKHTLYIELPANTETQALFIWIATISKIEEQFKSKFIKYTRMHSLFARLITISNKSFPGQDSDEEVLCAYIGYSSKKMQYDDKNIPKLMQLGSGSNSAGVFFICTIDDVPKKMLPFLNDELSKGGDSEKSGWANTIRSGVSYYTYSLMNILHVAKPCIEEGSLLYKRNYKTAYEEFLQRMIDFSIEGNRDVN